MALEFKFCAAYTLARFSPMADPTERAGRFRFGDFEADLQSGELRRRGHRLRVTGRPIQILALLLERPGELLTRKELQEKLWPADTFVDFEHGVNSAVQTLRRALCDSHKKPRFIETLPRRGYRFIAPVERIADPRPLEGTALALQPGAATGAEELSAESLALVGQPGVVVDSGGKNFVLLPRDESVLLEMEGCEAAKDDLGISLLVAGGKLLMVACGTRVKILDARDPQRGCQVRILGGEFIGERAFVPRKNLEVSDSTSAASAWA